MTILDHGRPVYLVNQRIALEALMIALDDPDDPANIAAVYRVLVAEIAPWN